MTTGSWSHALIRDMKLPANQFMRTEVAVVMRDKYPKAMHHFLVIPWADIDSVYQLSPADIPLLHEMRLLGVNAIETTGKSHDRFRLGFHMKPSMHRLHLHVISQDFVSDRLRYKEHFNSFVTEFFMPFESTLTGIVLELQDKGRIERRSQELIEHLLRLPLACNQCAFPCSTLPQLKKHLESHLDS
ncbi:FHA-HIT [Culex quinquefasciatus]|uniref:FHA-HIT n=1 Tax=Culex quinquefasciatus TaxID=7176 RepID=B0W3D1_CULQU|nr:FHA-HIT [Culex quinquefasciatus]|eukprot:XP_001843215.1 FHA-HIT [Culex quinquefasciatus]